MSPLGTLRWVMVLVGLFAAAPYVANAEHSNQPHETSVYKDARRIDRGQEILLEDVAYQIADSELLPGAVEQLGAIGLQDRERILEILSSLAVSEDVWQDATAVLEFPISDSPTLTGTRVPWYSRRLQYDSNEKDWDYIYTFRLNTNRFPPNQRLWYGEKWTCWVKRWGFPSTYWGDYYRNGSWYSEYLLGKNTVDWFTCYGYMELEYWY